MNFDNPVDESFYVSKCIELLEENLQRGKSAQWTNSDFQRLSDKIYESTKILISYQTLKRLFGRIKTHENYNPQAETKNAIAIFLGYEDWQHFKFRYSQEVSAINVAPDLNLFNNNADRVAKGPSSEISVVSSTPPVDSLQAESIRKVKNKWALYAAQKRWIGIIVLLVLSSALLYVLWPVKNPEVQPAPSFKGRNVKGTMPHTVVFDYDVSHLNTDTIFVDYDENKRFQTAAPYLPKDKHTITKTFFLPKLYKVRLLVGQDSFPVSTVHVLSDGWKAFVFDHSHNFLGPVPLRENPEGAMHISNEEVEQTVNLTKNQDYQVEYRNIANFAASGDDFTFETKVKLNARNNLSCRDFSLLFFGAERTLRVTFVKPGCYGWVRVGAGDVYLNGKFQDLSAFARDLEQWRTLRIEVKNYKAHIFLDEKPIYQIAYKKNVGPLKGLIYGFNGGGSVDFIQMQNGKGEVVYKEDFEQF